MADSSPLHEYSSSQAVVMGTWDYFHLPPVPAVANSLDRMAALLTGPWCDWPQDRVITVENERDPGGLPDRLITAFEKVTGIALFYYAGHGQIDLDDQLCLGLTGSRLEPNRRAATSLPFHAVRRALLDSPAATKIVILDCCFAGLASLPANTLAAFPGDVLDKTAGTGAYTLTASGAYTTAWYETGPEISRPQTYFTKYFADLVEAGIPGHPSVLRIHPMFISLRENLARDGRPIPCERSVDAARDFAFARNAAPPQTHRDPDLELQRLSQRLAEAEARERTLRADVTVRTRELEWLRQQTRHIPSRGALEQHELQDAIRAAERRLGETTVALEIAATQRSSISSVPAQQPAPQADARGTAFSTPPRQATSTPAIGNAVPVLQSRFVTCGPPFCRLGFR